MHANIGTELCISETNLPTLMGLVFFLKNVDDMMCSHYYPVETMGPGYIEVKQQFDCFSKNSAGENTVLSLI